MTAARPLAGRRIAITRPRDQSRPLADRLRRLGAQVATVPAIRIEGPDPGGPLDEALRRLGEYDWVVVTSANGARACAARAGALGLGPTQSSSPRWAAVGPATAAALRAGGIRVAAMPARYLTAAIAQALGDVAGRRILLPRADAAGPELTAALRARGALVDEIIAYRTVLAPARSRARARRLIGGGDVDTVVFTSASTVRGLIRLLGEDRDALRPMTLACIGPVTAAALADEGLTPTVVAGDHTADGLADALVAHAVAQARPGQARAREEHHARDRAAR